MDLKKNNRNISFYSKLGFSSAVIQQRLIIHYTSTKLPILFHLYENTLESRKFLDHFFKNYVLENKEMLSYDLKKKIFSLYNKDANFNLQKFSFFEKSKMSLNLLLIILLIRSFPYQLFTIDLKSFILLYKITILNQLKSIISTSLFILNQIKENQKNFLNGVSKVLKSIFIKSFKNSFNIYLRYKQFVSRLSKRSKKYNLLFTNVIQRLLLKTHCLFEKYVIIFFAQQYFILNNMMYN